MKVKKAEAATDRQTLNNLGRRGEEGTAQLLLREV